MDFKRTRKWMGKNLALSDKFYTYLMVLLMLIVVSGWIWMDNWDETGLEFYIFICVSGWFILSCIFGFIYGYRKAHKR